MAHDTPAPGTPRKPRATPGKTRAQPGEKPEQIPAAPDAAGDALELLAESLAGLDDPSGFEIVLFERNAKGEREVLAKYAAADFDAWMIAQEWGGGQYIAQVRETATRKIRTQRTVLVAAAVKGTKRTSSPAAAAPTAGAQVADQTFALLMAMMQQSQAAAAAAMQQQTQIVTALLTKPADDTWKTMLPLLAQNNKPAGGILEAVQGLQALDSLAQSRGGGEIAAAAAEGGMSWIGPAIPAIIDLIKEAKRDAPAAAMPRRMPGPAAPTPVRKPAATPAPTPAAAAAPTPIAPSRTDATPAEPTPPASPSVSIDQDDDDDGEGIAAPDLVIGQIRAAIVASLLLNKGIDPAAIAADLLQVLHDDSLAEMLAGVEPGGLRPALMAGVPSEFAAMIETPVLDGIDRIEQLLREAAEEEDEHDGVLATIAPAPGDASA